MPDQPISGLPADLNGPYDAPLSPGTGRCMDASSIKRIPPHVIHVQLRVQRCRPSSFLYPPTTILQQHNLNHHLRISSGIALYFVHLPLRVFGYLPEGLPIMKSTLITAAALLGSAQAGVHKMKLQKISLEEQLVQHLFPIYESPIANSCSTGQRIHRDAGPATWPEVSRCPSHQPRRCHVPASAPQG